MEFLRKVFNRICEKKKRKETEEEKLAARLEPYSYYLYKAQCLVTWEDSSQSLLALCLVNLTFWSLSHLEWRFYGVFFSLLLLAVAHEAWFDHVWPEIRVDKAKPVLKSSKGSPPPQGVISVPEISHYATRVRAAVSAQYARLRHLRRSQPPVYCAIVCAGCLVTASIGSLCSGPTLFYLFAMCCMTLPGVIKHVLSDDWKKYLDELLKSLSSLIVPPEGNIDDFVPESNNENLILLNQACYNDWTPPSPDLSSLGDIVLPSYDDDSLDNLDSFLPPIIQESSRSSPDSDLAGLDFQSTHFNGKGEDLSEEPLNLRQTVAATLYRTFPMVFSGRSRPEEQFLMDGDETDSEFEIIENEEPTS